MNASVAVDGTYNPAARADPTELRCPEKGLQLIAAERCIQNAGCPRARTCELRPAALRMMAGARDDVSIPHKPPKSAPVEKPKRKCGYCGAMFVPARTTSKGCSHTCRVKLTRQEQATSGKSSNAYKMARAMGLSPAECVARVKRGGA